MTNRIELQAIVPAEMQGHRLDQAAAQLFPEYSRSRLQAWIKKGELRVDGAQQRSRDKVCAGASLQVEAELEQEVRWQAQDIALDIVYEDDSILVLNKPAGLVVHPAAGNWDGTLQNALLNFDPQLDTVPRSGIVHRLDKDTSGVMVVARTLKAHASLVNQLQNRSMSRIYTAVVKGDTPPTGTIEAAIDRNPRDRKKNGGC